MSRSDAERDAMIAQRMRGALTLLTDPLPTSGGTVYERIREMDAEALRLVVARCIKLAHDGLTPPPDRHTHAYNDLQPTPSDTEVVDGHLTRIHHWANGESRRYGVGHLIEMHAAEHDGGVLDPEPVPQPIPPAEAGSRRLLVTYVAYPHRAAFEPMSGNTDAVVDLPVDIQRIRGLEDNIRTLVQDERGVTIRQVIITGMFPLDPPRVSE